MVDEEEAEKLVLLHKPGQQVPRSSCWDFGAMMNQACLAEQHMKRDWTANALGVGVQGTNSPLNSPLAAAAAGDHVTPPTSYQRPQASSPPSASLRPEELLCCHHLQPLAPLLPLLWKGMCQVPPCPVTPRLEPRKLGAKVMLQHGTPGSKLSLEEPHRWAD